MRIGIYGGTFDPPHNGHLAVARAACTALSLDEVIFVPAQQNPLKSKKPVASARQRLAMVQLATQNEQQFAVSDQEIRRKGPSYTIDTLEELMAVRPAEYMLIIGLDAAIQFEQWKKPERIVKIARLGLVLREEESWENALSKISEAYREFIDPIPMKKVDISSTLIRERLFRVLSINPLVPAAVLKYIKDNKLYGC